MLERAAERPEHRTGVEVAGTRADGNTHNPSNVVVALSHLEAIASACSR